MRNNLILMTDSYKTTHWKQYPPKTEKIFSYVESRGGEYAETLFFGLQGFMRTYWEDNPITPYDIKQAEELIQGHLGQHFNKAGWEYIVTHHNGFLPLNIYAVPEGSIIPTGNVLVTVENTDPRCYWLTSYVETALLRAIWYPTTVATNSMHSKKVIKEMLIKTTGSADDLGFRLHDFGARGVSSHESAMIGGAAHLVNFLGTDTMESLSYVMENYDSEIPGFSVPASEHSSMTSWGRVGEGRAYANMLAQFAEPGTIVSVVSDSYDIYHAIDQLWGTALKQQVIESGATLVIRADSGDPVEVIIKILKLIDDKFGSETNQLGYKELKYVKVLQGDGVTTETIRAILEAMEQQGYAANNIVFGQGGALLQQVNRDTLKFAYKASWALVDGHGIPVFKDPITDKGKRSKQGRITTYYSKSANKYTTDEIGKTPISPWIDYNDWKPIMRQVYINGALMNQQTFDDIRKRADI